MRRLLLPLILFCSIPFNTSCISEVTFKVTVGYYDLDNQHCSWVTPLKKAVRAHDYSIQFYDEDGWELYEDENCFHIKNATFETLLRPHWKYENHILTINGDSVNGNIEVLINPDVTQ